MTKTFGQAKNRVIKIDRVLKITLFSAIIHLPTVIFRSISV